VYIPAVFVSGLNVPLFPPERVDGPVQAPVEEGAPPSNPNKFTEAPEAQMDVVLLVPAEILGLTVSV
jgi:hypothetical protein